MKATTKKITLPQGIQKSDLSPPTGKGKDRIAWDEGDHGGLTFYETQGFGWVITTLLIGGGRRGNPARYYGVRVSDGAPVRVGNGPHVKQVIKVYITEARKKHLQPFIDLYNKGSISAGNIRDRISSRRAIGQQMRAQGRTSWLW